jgi:hypothetical protein
VVAGATVKEVIFDTDKFTIIICAYNILQRFQLKKQQQNFLKEEITFTNRTY